MKQLISRLVYMFEVILVALWASVAQAQLDSNQTYPDYKTPGVCPYAGNPEWAGKNLQPKTGLPYEQFMVGVAKWKAGQCEEYFVQDGEIIGTTSTCPGQGHKVSVVRVAFGDDISPKDPIRRGLSCDVGNSHGCPVCRAVAG